MEIKFTVKPMQRTKKYFMYYESDKPIKEAEEKLRQVAINRHYGHMKIIIKNVKKVHGSDTIIL